MKSYNKLYIQKVQNMSAEEKIPWEDSYSVGIKSIDNQHRKLFDLVNKLYEIEDTKDVKEKIREILYAFRDYTIVHFKDEEEYMRAVGYPDLEQHKKIHEDIIESLASIIHTPAKLGIIKSKMRLLSKRILIDHIINEDHKIGVYVKENEQVFNLNDFTF